MSNAKKDKPELKGLPEPEIQIKKRRISIVWLVPLVALAIGGWLVYKAISEKGPTVTITFKSAEGLEAGKTKIKYKDVELGQVTSIELNDELSEAIVKADMVKQAEKIISENTRFWNASGLDVAVGAEGIQIDTESFASLMIGGIAFDTPAGQEAGEPAKENDVFRLYKNLESISEKTYVRKTRWLLHFDGDVRGLNIGAPVELHGIQIGQVLDVNLEFDLDTEAFRVPVLIETEPDRIKTAGKIPEGVERQKIMDYLVEKGLRAQLKTGSLITGQLLVAIDMHPGEPPAKINWEGSYPEIPTVPTAMEEITTSLTQLLRKLEKLPIEQIGIDLRDTVAGAKRLINSAELQDSITALDQTLNQAQIFAASLNTSIAPELKTAVSNLNSALIQAQKLTKSLNSNVSPQADRTLKELQAAARSIKVWAAYLERNPEALIRGKSKSKRR